MLELCVWSACVSARVHHIPLIAPRPHTDAFAVKKDAMRCRQPKKVKRKEADAAVNCAVLQKSNLRGPRQLGCVGHAADVLNFEQARGCNRTGNSRARTTRHTTLPPPVPEN